jgi:hypothetical protein
MSPRIEIKMTGRGLRSRPVGARPYSSCRTRLLALPQSLCQCAEPSRAVRSDRLASSARQRDFAAGDDRDMVATVTPAAAANLMAA